ncbi:hypothetical protein OH77DRAFT_689952 [Trametes cingulata]|nr:hypothetical protein OH77DRAFT_689952 [Trametes cingulata]
MLRRLAVQKASELSCLEPPQDAVLLMDSPRQIFNGDYFGVVPHAALDGPLVAETIPGTPLLLSTESLNNPNDGAEMPSPIFRAPSAMRSLRPPRLGRLPRTWQLVGYRLRRRLAAGVRSVRQYWVRAPAPAPRPVPRPMVGVYTRSASPSLSSPPSVELCAACRTDITLGEEDAVQVPCRHVYHTECLLMLVEVSMRTPSQFPPSCCRGTIPTSLFYRLLTPGQRKTFGLRELEHSTRRRVYCANVRCSSFLGPRDKRTPVLIYTCADASCATRTCARCRAAVDPSIDARTHECKHDAGHRMALEMGTRLGWRRCPECEELIERRSGCPHMTCVCGTEFCYGCGNRYGSCTCHQSRNMPRLEAPRFEVFPPQPLPPTPPHRPQYLQARRLELWIPPAVQMDEAPPEAHAFLYESPQDEEDDEPWWDAPGPAALEQTPHEEAPWFPDSPPPPVAESETETMASNETTRGVALVDDLPLQTWVEAALILRGEMVQRIRGVA